MPTPSATRARLRVPGPVALEREGLPQARTTFETTHAGEALKQLARGYGIRVRGSCASREVTFRQQRVAVGSASIDEISTTASTELQVASLRHLVVATVVQGSLRCEVSGTTQVCGAGDHVVLGGPGQQLVVGVDAPTLRLVLLDPLLLPAAATDGLQLAGRRPVSEHAAAAWDEAVRASRTLTLAHQGSAALPRLMQPLAQVLAAAAVSTFVAEAAGEPGSSTAGEPVPRTLRRALELLDGSTGEPISVEDVARTVGVTQRALQYTFRRHLDTTPAAYLRRVRLERVHAELLRADPRDGATVAQVAARWGFHHPGQFAALYRATFGQRPSTTLHADRFDQPVGGITGG